MTLVYRPRIQHQLADPCYIRRPDGTLYRSAGDNCTCFAGAMAADRHTMGRTVPSGCAVRRRTHDTAGGTNLGQVAYALSAGWAVVLDIRYRVRWTDVFRLIDEGRGAIIQGQYWVIRDSPFRGSETFSGGHAVYVNEVRDDGRFLVYDPLADGRRAGLADGPDWWPGTLLRKFAGALRFPTGAVLGDGLAYAAFTRVTPTIQPPVPASARLRMSYQPATPMLNENGSPARCRVRGPLAHWTISPVTLKGEARFSPGAEFTVYGDGYLPVPWPGYHTPAGRSGPPIVLVVRPGSRKVSYLLQADTDWPADYTRPRA